jgi:hypothetical protein
MRDRLAIVPESVGQALWHYYEDISTGRKIPAIGALRYFRFYAPVRLEKAIIHTQHNTGGLLFLRQPAELVIEAWNDKSNTWEMIGRKFFKKSLSSEIQIDFDGLTSRVVKLHCLNYHPPRQNCREQWANPYNVPYFIFNNVEWQGRALSKFQCDVPVAPELKVDCNRPRSGRGQRVLRENDSVYFKAPAFSAGFSLRRPLMMHMGWDGAARGKSNDNLLFHRTSWHEFGHLRLASGPLWHTINWEAPARFWGGRVSVEDNVVSYRHLHVTDEVTIDADFEIRPDGMDVQLSQNSNSRRETIECEAWRWVWNGRAATVATCGMPCLNEGRTGAVALPAYWTAPGYGNLSCESSSSTARLQVDTWRANDIGWAGIVFGQKGSYPTSYKPGTEKHQAKLSFRVLNIAPNGTRRRPIHAELRRNWGPGLTFRAELAGFSNNALSCNCHLSQTGVTDLAAATAIPKTGPAPIELARHTATLALKDGRGYGDNRDVYLDSDPSILNMAGRIQQVAPDIEWLLDVYPFIVRAAERILAKSDATGLIVARHASGNFGDTPAITNAWDVVNFGHYDGYSNVEAYRALKNVAGLASAAGDEKTLNKVNRAAILMKKNFSRCFFNPKSGWLGTWRSRDGKLHDYGMLCINAAACLYGLVPARRARRILERLEARRLELNLDNFRWGLPTVLTPIRRDDYQVRQIGQGLRDDGRDAFGIFCNGCLTLGLAQYYIRAMTIFGFTKVADQMAREILEGHSLGRLVGGVGSGLEFHTFEGMICGYEGAYVLQFPALLAIAQHLGLANLPVPEFWLPTTR